MWVGLISRAGLMQLGICDGGWRIEEDLSALLSGSYWLKADLGAVGSLELETRCWRFTEPIGGRVARDTT